MRVAQVAPLWEQVPPVGYGGTETVVYDSGADQEIGGSSIIIHIK